MPRLRQSSGDIDNCGECIDAGCGTDTRDVVHAVLQTDDNRARRKMRRDGTCGFFGVKRLHTKQHEFGVAHTRWIRGRFDGNMLLEGHGIDQKSAAADRFGVRRSGNQRHAATRAREHAAKIRSHGTRSHDRDSRGRICRIRS
jgi:hypothetical protein